MTKNMDELTMKPGYGSLVAEFRYLYLRWHGEKEWTDFTEYRTALKRAEPIGVEITNFTSKPFRATIVCGGKTYTLACSREKVALSVFE